jgi:hypothetical protein
MRVKSLLVAALNPVAAARSMATRRWPINSIKPIPSILLNTMPKSGSVFVQRTLSTLLKVDQKYIGNCYALTDQINVRDAEAISQGNFVSQNHLAPSKENLQILRHFGLKMVLHLRDPRQALLSWVHHLDWITDGNDTSPWLLYFEPRTPLGYFNWPFHEKVDWQIENFLPQLVHWTERWVQIADSGVFPVLITQYRDLQANEKAFFESILAFYGLETDYVPAKLPRTMSETHYRLADPTEWSRVLTPAQTVKATDAISSRLRARFGWTCPGKIVEVARWANNAGFRTASACAEGL